MEQKRASSISAGKSGNKLANSSSDREEGPRQTRVSQTTQTSPSIQIHNKHIAQTVAANSKPTVTHNKQQAQVVVSSSPPFQDPIQSIANVLNHHHKHLLAGQQAQQREGKNLSPTKSGAGENFRAASGSDGPAQVSESQSRHLLPRVGPARQTTDNLQQQQQQQGRSVLLTVDNSASHQRIGAGGEKKSNASGGDTSQASSRPANDRQEPQKERKVVAALDQILERADGKLASKLNSSPAHTTSSAESTSATTSQQVEQGNSYLYAYNDFISPASAAAHLSSSVSAAAASAVTVSQKSLSTNKQQVASQPLDKSKTNNQQAQIRKSNELQRTSAKQQQVVGGEQRTRQQQKQQAKQSERRRNKSERELHNSRIARLAESSSSDTRTSLLGGQVCLLTGETLSPGQVSELQRQQQVAGVDEESDCEDSRQNSQDEDEDDEDGGAALNYILNRHNLLIAQHHQQQQNQQQVLVNQATSSLQRHQNCNLLHLNGGASSRNQSSLGDQQQQQQHQACKHDNPNHLRQYLQIEENFNSYKAARRRRPTTAGIDLGAPGSEEELHQVAGASLSEHEQQVVGDLFEQAQQAEKHSQKALTRKQQQQQQFLSFQPPPPPTATGSQASQSSNGSGNNLLLHQASGQTKQTNYLSSSQSLSSSLSSLNQRQEVPLNSLNLLRNHQQQQQQQQQEQQEASAGRSYLHFFSRFAPASLNLNHLNQLVVGASGGGGQKMYSASEQHYEPQLGQLAGQPGAYYVTNTHSTSGAPSVVGAGGAAAHQTPHEAAAGLNHLHHHQHQLHNHAHHLQHAHHPPHLAAGGHHHHHHPHHPQHHHHHHHHSTNSYPITTSSDSSLGSSGAFASSAVRRTTSLLRDFCSKKCLFITCLMLILFIFILVISLSAYLNFLINSNKTNLQPLSGRLRVSAELLMQGQPPPPSSSSLSSQGSSSNSQESPDFISANTTNITQQQMVKALVTNRTSSEFLQKQRDFETILRGALDRTQSMLKSYPNHLVKLEVYSFKPTTTTTTTTTTATQTSTNPLPQGLREQAQQLWVYFRLFINKRTLQQDNLLMKRKSPDEQFDKQFLPRLTQQTLLNGFEQLITTFGGNSGLEPSASAAAQLGINSRRFGQTAGPEVGGARRSSRAVPNSSRVAAEQSAGGPSKLPQSQQLRSFDEQISRLMHLIEAIDLQSIYVTPEFDLSQSAGLAGGDSPQQVAQITSETLRASQPLAPTTTAATATTTQTTTTTTPTNVMLATGSTGDQYETIQLEGTQGGNRNKLPTTSVKEGAESAVGSTPASTTRKFTLSQSYRENSTRPSASSAAPSPTTTPRPGSSSTQTNAKESLFLLNHQQKPPKAAQGASTTKPKQQPSGTLRDIAQGSRQTSGAVVRLVSGQPVTSQAGQTTHEKLAAQASQAQEAANKLQQGASLFGPVGLNKSSTTSTSPGGSRTSNSRVPAASSTPVSIEELWQSAFNGNANRSQLQNFTGELELQGATGGGGPFESQQQNNAPGRRLITVTTIGQPSTSAAGAATTSGPQEQPPIARQHQPTEWQKVSVLSSDVANTIRAQLNASLGGNQALGGDQQPIQTTTLTPSTSARPPKVSPHLNFGGSIISTGGGGNNGNFGLPQNSNNNNQTAKPARAQQQPPSSAVVLNRDFAAVQAGSGGGSGSTSATSVNGTRATQAPKKKKQKSQAQQRLSATSGANDQAGQPLRPTRNSTSNATPKPQQQPKPAKVKKISSPNPSSSSTTSTTTTTTATSAGAQQATANNETATTESGGGADSSADRTPTSANEPTKPSKGIRIVDNFLASIGSTQAPSERDAPPNRTASAPTSDRTLRDQFLPTTNTIELTRSTTALPPARTTPMPATSGRVNNQPAAGARQDNNFVLASQQARPGTTSFSGQWRPLSSSSSSSSSSSNSGESDFWNAPAGGQRPPNNNGSSTSNRSQQQRPGSNLSLIVATERLPATLNSATGSQSPFAMPNAALVMQPAAPQQQFANRFRAGGPAGQRTTTPSNDFESHRVSRMRQNAAHSHRSSEQSDPFGASSSSLESTSSSSGSSSTTTSTTTVSSVAATSANPSSTRIVDDFMITTDRNDGGSGGRATTLIPPLVLSGLHQSAQLAPPISLVVSQGPKRTRGPFAFETLRSFATTTTPAESNSDGSSGPNISPPSEPFDVSSSFEVPSEPSAVTSVRSERSPERNQQARQQQQQQQQQQVLTDEKLLLRKRLFVGGGANDEPAEEQSASGSASVTDASEDLSFAPSTNSPILRTTTGSEPTTPGLDVEPPELALSSAKFGNRFGRLGSRDYRETTGADQTRQETPKCPVLGCRVKGDHRPDSEAITCLNASQICDDLVDCQDESDELNCVSLLMLDPKTNKMTPSTGAGIIYLNRRGLPAPMCVDSTPTGTSNGPGETNDQNRNQDRTTGISSSNNGTKQLEDELIRQINTIGQYACGLQSFARLVSFKIDKHNSEDELDREIRGSKVFHQLKVSEPPEGGLEIQPSEQTTAEGDRISASSIFRSPSQFQVEISTTSECPSQRTVFVKCGSIECNQHSPLGMIAKP